MDERIKELQNIFYEEDLPRNLQQQSNEFENQSESIPKREGNADDNVERGVGKSNSGAEGIRSETQSVNPNNGEGEKIDFNIVPVSASQQYQEKHKRAIELFNSKTPLEEIWEQTGFFLRQNTHSGKWEWAYRIDQNKMEITLPENIKVGDTFALGDVVDYPEFFDIFPNAKAAVTIKIVKDANRKSVMDMSKDGKTLTINLAYYNGNERTETNTKKTIAEEIQHYIQVSAESGGGITSSGIREKTKIWFDTRLGDLGRKIANGNLSDQESGRINVSISALKEAQEYYNNGKKVPQEVIDKVKILEDKMYLDNIGEREGRLAGTDFTKSPYQSYNEDAESLGIEQKDFEKETSQLRDNSVQRQQNPIVNESTITKEAFDKLINNLKKPFANAFKNLDVTTDWNTFIKKANDLGLQIENLQTLTGEVYGAKLPDGTLYFNPEKLNVNTAIHEFSHLWEQLMPNRWKSGVELFKQTTRGKEIFNQLKNEGNYGTDENKIWSEALNTFLGEYGESKLKNPRGKMKQLLDWIKNFFSKLGEVTGFNQKNNRPLTLEDTFLQFAEGVIGDVMGGKPLFLEGKTNTQLSEMQMSLLSVSDFNADGTVKESVQKEVAEEKARIEAAAKANGTWMKAPNGNPTNLNEEPWVDVRTKRFKEWFGDWETEAEQKANERRIQKLLDADNDTSKGIQRETIANVTPEQAVLLNEKLGIDAIGFKHTIDKSEIIHTLNQHGEAKTESNRGQIPITENDFLKLPTILNNPDKIEYSGKNKKGLDTIKYTKAFNGTTYVVKEVRTGKKELALNTMYKRKTKDMGEQLQNTTALTSVTLPQSKDTKTSEVSKVVDENGEPLVVYHVSPDIKFVEEGVFDSFNGVHWFSKDKETAMSYADDRRAFKNAILGIVEKVGRCLKVRQIARTYNQQL